MRLIDADALMEKICAGCSQADCVPDATDTVYGCILSESIDKMPTIEAEPVQHGQWIEDVSRGSYSIYCSCCGCHKETICPSNYCPNCGSMNLEM